MAKLALVPVLFVIACLFAGIYGALHDQISYSVSTEYYSQFKFHQFQIDDSIHNRIGVAIVGWLATWWMGLVIGIFLIPAGLVIHGTSQYFWCMIRVFAVVVVTTMVVGLGALFYAFIAIDITTVDETRRYGNKIINEVAFARAGTMHNFSYLGGLLGITAGWLYIYWCRRRPTSERRIDGE